MPLHSAFLSEANYTRFNGRFCPVCRHQTLEFGDISTDGTSSIEQQVWCATCGAAWQDEYKLARFVDLEPPASPPYGVTSRVEVVVVVAGSDGEETSFPTDFLVLHEYGRLREEDILRFARDIVGFVRMKEHTLTEVLS